MSELKSISVSTENGATNIARLIDEGKSDQPCFVWLGGFRSDMRGSKAEALSNFCVENGFGCVRFDYSGHGESGGNFDDGSISIWLAETLAVLADIKAQKLILVGSSMGGWISLRVAEEMQKPNQQDRLGAMVLVAPAPDFATELMAPKFTDEQRALLESQGYFDEPSEYSPEPVRINKKMIDDGRLNKVLDKPINTHCPVFILQGMKDPDVPYQHALRLVSHLAQDNVTLTFVKDGDHRLSRNEDIEALLRFCSLAATQVLEH